MRYFVSALAFSAIAFNGGSYGFITAALSQGLSKAEQVYAELAKLPADQRAARIIEGARKEGHFRFVHSLRGTTGRNQTEAFEKRFPFLKVELTEVGSQDAAERLVTEEAVGRHLTDLAVVEPADTTVILARNLAARYPTPAIGRILPEYKIFIEPENRWVPFEANEHGLSYNTDLVKSPPKSYEELCEPQYKGRVSFDPLEVRFLMGIYKVFNDDLARVERFLKCMGENQPIIQRGHEQRSGLMIAGDHAASPDSYFFSGLIAKKNHPSIPFAADYEVPVTVSAVTSVINRNAENPYAAALFADWSLSDEAQQIQANDFRGPVAMKHPFFPKDAKLIAYVTVSKEIEDALVALWVKYMPTK
jgi:iron(III) transport system substrate-binding protein